jgi:anti-sigma factor ChrR (cupin superfamily)
VTTPAANHCGEALRVAAYAIRRLGSGEVEVVEAHLAGCPSCRRDFEELRPVADYVAAWPADILSPDPALQGRLARRLGNDANFSAPPAPAAAWREPDWDEVGPGILCKVLANDAERRRVSMLVRLLPNAEYPPHRHAGVEELHLLEGELWIDERKLFPGDYNRAEAPSGDKRVWSETGCTCVLITSTDDILA